MSTSSSSSSSFFSSSAAARRRRRRPAAAAAAAAAAHGHVLDLSMPASMTAARLLALHVLDERGDARLVGLGLAAGDDDGLDLVRRRLGVAA